MMPEVDIPVAEKKEAKLLGRSVQGLFFSGGTQVIAQLLHMCVRLLMARLLLPQDFGVVSMAMVFVSFVGLLSDLGLGMAVVHRRELTDDERCTLFWVTLLFATLMYVPFYFAAPFAGHFFKSTNVVPVLRAMGLIFVFGTLDNVYTPLFRRDMKFGRIGICNIIGVLLGGVIGVVMAMHGWGVWGLVMYNLSETLITSVLLMLASTWRPEFRFSRSAFSNLWSFGSAVVVSRIMNFFNRNLDNMLIGRYLGENPLGFYSLAYQSINLPQRYIGRPITAVGFPAFSKIQEDLPRCRNAYISTLRVLCMASWLLAALGVFAGPAAIPLILGHKWASAVIPFQILSVVSAIQSMTSLSSSLFTGVGRPELNSRWSAIMLSTNVLGFVIGLHWGVAGVATGYLISTVIAIPIHFRMVVRLIDLPVRPLVSLLLRGVICFLLLGVAWKGCSLLIGSAGVIRFGVCLVVGIATYFLATFLLLRNAWSFVGRARRAFSQVGQES